MALTQDRDLEFFASSELLDFPVDANAKVYKGAFVGRNRSTNYARALVAGDEFLGVAYRRADNTFAGNTAGGIDVRVFQGLDIVDALAGSAAADVGKDVYASDDATLTLSSSGTSRIGRIVQVLSGGLVRVRCQPAHELTGLGEGYGVTFLGDVAQTLGQQHLNRVLLMANTAARTLTLPPVASARAGAWIRIVKTNAAAFAITIDPNGAETVDGAATLATIDAQYDGAHLVCTGTEWIVLARDIS